MINVSYTQIVNQSQSCQPLLTDSIPIVSCHNRDRREHVNLLVNVSYSDRQPIPIPILWATPDSLHMQNWSRPSRAAFHLFVQSIKSNHEGHSILAFRIFWYLWNNQVCKIVWYVMDQEDDLIMQRSFSNYLRAPGKALWVSDTKDTLWWHWSSKSRN